MQNNEKATVIYSLIHRLGGPTFVARQLKVSVSTVHAWIRQGRIPSMQKQVELFEIKRKLQEVLK